MKRDEDVAALAVLQARVLERAAGAVKPGGRLVYCTCSLEPEEGSQQIAKFLAAHPEFKRMPVDGGALGIDPAWLTCDGDLRTLPCHAADFPDGQRGLDGFYAASLIRTI